MNNPFDEMKKAINDASRILSAADSVADSMARLLRGRLKHCDPWVIADIKRELRDFNIHTEKWKNKND